MDLNIRQPAALRTLVPHAGKRRDQAAALGTSYTIKIATTSEEVGAFQRIRRLVYNTFK